MARQPRFTRKAIIAYIRYHKLDPRLVGLTVFRTNGRTYSAGTIRTYLYLGREIGDAFQKSMEDWYEREILELPHAPPELPKRFPMAPEGLLADPEETPIHVLIERRNRARERSCLSEAKIYDDMINGRLLNIIGSGQRSDFGGVHSVSDSLTRRTRES